MRPDRDVYSVEVSVSLAEVDCRTSRAASMAWQDVTMDVTVCSCIRALHSFSGGHGRTQVVQLRRVLAVQQPAHEEPRGLLIEAVVAR